MLWERRAVAFLRNVLQNENLTEGVKERAWPELDTR
jgi:hypothetical protein